MIRELFARAILCTLLVMPAISRAQAPVAAFTANKTSGCSPVVVQFTDQSTGSPTSWFWDLGNGGTSTLQNPAASYITPGTYTVILTATNSNGSSKDTNYITVFTSPTVAFTADTLSACVSKIVQFTNQTIPGVGGAVSYLWDFGDGDSSTSVNPIHSYTYAGNFSVSLVVTNSSGCTNTLTKNNYINIIPKPTTGFTANNTSSCNAPFQVTFTNSTTNAVSYSWSFGDGNNSTATNPVHTYTSSGTYTVRLIATGSNGCVDTLTRTAYIVIGQVNAGFTVGPACVGKPTSFTNTTTPGPGGSRLWTFGNGNTDTVVNPTNTYASTGTYTVTLIEQYANNCNDTVSQSVTVVGNPTAQFVSADTVGCAVPFTANFTNTSTGATSYAWLSGPASSTQTNPGLQYNTLGTYSVRLIATSSAGCKDTFTRNNYIKLKVPSATLTALPAGGCPNQNIQFTSTVDTPLFATNYRWDFGDGSSIVNCATCSTQTHAYASTGTYNVQLIVTTATGCYDTVLKTVIISSKPTAGFTGSPLTICPDASVTFTNSSTGALTYTWSFGDGLSAITTNPSHPYNNTGVYNVRLIATNNGCSDTLTRNAYVTVQLPKADFRPTFQCSARLAYTFVDSSLGASTYSWNFGDGNTATTPGTATHTYSVAGTYSVRLIVTNTPSGCSDTVIKVITAAPITIPSWAATHTNLCYQERVNIIIGGPYNLTLNWYSPPASIIPIDSHMVNFGYYVKGGTFDVKLVVTDSNGCKDSITKANYFKVGGPNVNFTVSNPNPCKEAPVLFDDISTTTPFTAANRYWDFGDGVKTNTSTDTITHSFNNPGPYDIKLVVTDSIGCKDSLTKSAFIYAHKPTAQFHTSDTLICAGDTVSFVNESGGTSFTSFWNFGDGNTGTLVTPKHSYTAIGNYTVKLTITDSFGCKDSATRVDYIKVQKPTAAFSMSDSFGACPPLSVNFTNNSVNGVSYLWTFGNNNQSSFTNPSNTYTYPGIYTVKLVATNSAGCKDSTTKTVTVNGPTGSYSYTPLSGCNPLNIQFTAISSNTTSYIWDMNNGFTQTTGTGTFSYTYTQTGRYVPKLILSDGGSCQVPLQKTDTIIVDQVNADFTFTTAGNLCNNDTVFFNDTVSYSLSAISSRSWNFGDGNTSTAQDPTHFYNAPGTYQVRLIVTNGNGCIDTVIKTVIVRGLPTVIIAASGDSICPGQPTGVQLTATGASTYAWTPSTGLSCTNCANPMANPQVNTTYIVTGTDTNGCTNRDTITIGIKPKPVLNISADTTICQTASAQILVTGATTYAWTPSTGLSCSNCANPVASPVSTTAYSVIGTNASGCMDTAAITVTVIAKPVVSAGADKTICNGDSTLLTATGASTYTWSPTTALSCVACPGTYAKPTATTVYSAIGTAVNGCKDTATVTVNVNALPTVSGGPDKSICFGTSTSLAATGATSYTWTPSTALSCTNCASPTANPTTTTTYIVTGTDGNSCTDTAAVTVTVNPLPTVSAGPDKTICVGFGTSLLATGATTYVWTPATGLSCTNCANPTATPAVTTVYTVTGTDGNTCTDTGLVTVTVNPQPIVSGGANGNICPGDTAQLQASGAITYTWSPATGLSCTNCANPKASPAVTTTYTVIGTDANGCKDTATVNVNLNTVPIVSAGADKAICFGSNTILQATGAATYTWSPATGLSCTNCSNPTANPASTTVYTVIGTNGSSCKDTATVTVTVNPLPTVSAGPDKTICVGFSTSLQATGATSYNWTPVTGLSFSNIPNPTATPVTTTIYTVTGTDANGCIDTGVVTVNVNPQPVVSGGANKTICLNDSAQLQGTGALSYVWSPTTGLSSSVIANPKASPAATTVYTVIGTDVNGCKDTATVTVTVNALPVVGAGANQTICNGSNIQLTATGAVTYTWTPTTGLSCSNCPNPIASPTTTTTYTITGTNANGCVNTGQITITVNQLPNVSAGSNQSICLKDSVLLTATGATSYVWAPTAGLFCSTCSATKASPASTTTYTVTGTDANGCVNNSSVIVTVKPLPAVSAGSDATICIGNSTQLQATGASAYTWTPTTGLSLSNIPNPVANPVITTQYIVTGTAANACIAKDTVVVNVNPLPVVSAGANVDICIGDSAQLQATGAVNYTWSPTTGLSLANISNPKASPTVTTFYTVTGTDANGCKDTGGITVNVKLLPVITATAARTTICDGDTTQLLATGGTSYSWTPNNVLSSGSIQNPVASPIFTTNFVVTGTDNGCSDTASVSINVLIKPSVSAGPDVAYCNGGSDSLHASGALTYTWSPATALSCTNCPDPLTTAVTTTIYSVTGTDGNGCRNTDNVTVTVYTLPPVNAGDDKTICEGDSVQLLAKGALNYVWSPAQGLSCINCADPFATTPNTTTFTVTGTDGNGCNNTDDVTVTAILKKSVSFTVSDTICMGERVNLFADGGTSYAWWPTEGHSNPQGANTSVAPTITTQYRVIIKQGDCFTDTGYSTVAVFGPPTINAGPDQTVRGGSEVTIETKSKDVAVYEWTPAADLSCSDCKNPVITPKRTTTYTVKAISEHGCVAQDDVTIYVTCGSDQIFVANTFTPNNDGVNDVFFPQGKGLSEVKRFSIYSRWGELIFDAQNIPLNNPAYGWDGTHKHELLKPDVFVYIIRALCENGEPIEIKGDISLIR